MSVQVRTISLAADELAEAIRWYESRCPGLGADLLGEADRAVRQIAASVTVGAPLSSDRKTRRVLLSRFPFQVVYQIRPSGIVIVAFAHSRRRPGYWLNRT